MKRKFAPHLISDGISAATKIIIIYVIAGGFWILVSDRVLAALITNPRTLTYLQTFKGWFFIVTTAAILYFLIRRSFTAIRNSQQALFESERTLSTLLSNLPGMVYRCRNDRDWTMEFVSEGCFDLTGYHSSELIHNSKVAYGDLIHPDDQEMVWNEVQKAIAEDRPFRLIYRILGPAGEEKWVWEQGQGLASKKGPIQFVEGFITDITDRRRAELALRNSEEKYRVLVENTSDAILMIDPQNEIISCNPAFRELFGFDLEEQVEGKSVSIIHPSDESFKIFCAHAYPEAEQAGAFRSEWEMKRKDGTIMPVETTLSPIKNSDRSIKAYVAIIRDITKRKKAEEELRKHREHLEEMVKQRTLDLEAAQKALVQKEKLKTLGAISAEVAHEIRNPLFVIGGFAKRLQKKFPDLPEVEIILDESRRLEKILKRIKNYLKPVEMRPQQSSANNVIKECIDLLSIELERQRVAWQLDLAPNLSPAYVDPGILAEVFINVLRNGIRFMDKNGYIYIKTYESDQNIQIDFRIPVLKQKIKDPELFFLPFDETSQDFGLSLSFRLLKDMGGLLSYSQEDDDVIFSVSLLKAMKVSLQQTQSTENHNG